MVDESEHDAVVSRPPRDPALRGLVDVLWVWRVPPEAAPETLLPSATSQLVLSLDHEAQDAFLQGPTTHAATIDPRGAGRIAGASFGPGGMAALTRESADSLADRTVPVDLLGRWPSPSLVERAGAVTDPNALLDVLEADLLAAASRPVDAALLAAEQALRGGVDVASVASSLGLERRVLASRTRTFLGMTPKRYARIQRFVRAVTALRQVEPDSLARIAVSSGYADQSHLTREVRELAGVTPGVLHGWQSRSPNHLVEDETFKTA